MPRRNVIRLHFVNRPFRNNLSNNNQRNPIIYMRDNLFHAVFIRFALIYGRVFSQTERKIIEMIFLTMAFMSLLTLTYIHVVFVRSSTNCFDNVQQKWSRSGILRAEVLHKKDKLNYTLEQSYLKERKLRQYEYEDPLYIFNSNAFLKSREKSSVKQERNENVHTVEDYTLVSEILDGNESFSVYKHSVHGGENSDGLYIFSPMWPSDEYIVEFSLEYGFLKLSPSVRKRLNISVTLVTLERETEKCFGNFFNRFLLEHFIGYDDVLLASLRSLAEKEDYKGYVRNVVTETEFVFVNIWMNETSYFTAGFVMLVFTVSISILLRYSHHQIFVFIVELLHMLEFHSSINFPAAPLLTVILALVGMEAIMAEFFNDTAIAFYVILIVWTADQFDTFCCQSNISKQYWLRFFYLYHFFFYAYSHRFNGHYSSLALLTSWLFILHSMIHFFHRYELPLLFQLANNASNQNQGNNSQPRNEPPENPEASSQRTVPSSNYSEEPTALASGQNTTQDGPHDQNSTPGGDSVDETVAPSEDPSERDSGNNSSPSHNTRRYNNSLKILRCIILKKDLSSYQLRSNARQVFTNTDLKSKEILNFTSSKSQSSKRSVCLVGL
ncbi:Membralin, partial [Stegodyphus mimosarum]